MPLRRALLLLVICLFFSAAPTAAQSGRAVPKPSPTPAEPEDQIKVFT